MMHVTDQPIVIEKSFPPVALITGVTGQDGAYLADFLLKKGYKVFGIKRRSSLINTLRVDHLYNHPNFKMVYGDLTDSLNLVKIINETQPDEIYNLGAMSHVAVSFEMPEYTSNTDALGALRILEALKILGLTKTKYYQASTSELYGKVLETPQTEKTPFYPRSPYAIAKQFAFSTTVNYREQGFFACNGILFNHESPTRGETFVTRKIVRGIIGQLLGKSDCLYLGNLNALRDWGHARDFVKGMWLMLQQPEPDDYVLATGQLTSVRSFVQKVCTALNIEIEFTGEGIHEKAIVVADNNSRGFYPKFKQLQQGQELVKISEKYFRPTEVDLLLGDATKAKNILGWEPKCTVDEMIKEMIEYDLQDLTR